MTDYYSRASVTLEPSNLPINRELYFVQSAYLGISGRFAVATYSQMDFSRPRRLRFGLKMHTESNSDSCER
jgi:hypothetical protein